MHTLGSGHSCEDSSSIEQPVANAINRGSEESLEAQDGNKSAISNFINEAFSLNQSAYVAEQVLRKKEMARTSSKLNFSSKED